LVSLQTQAVHSVKWTTLKTGVVAATGPVIQIILARFLLPADFAHIAIIMIFVGLFKTLENLGISQAIIQRDSISSKEISSLFYFNIMICLTFGFLLYIASSYLALVFSLPRLSFYLKLTSAVVIFGGPSNLFRALLHKNLLFKEYSLIEITVNILRFFITVYLLFMGYKVTAVIFGHITTELIRTLMTFYITKKNNLSNIILYFNFKCTKPFLRFGAFATGKQLVSFAAYRMDEILIGYFLSPEILGIYYFGKNMLERLRELLSSSFSSVLYPVFSKIKNDIDRLSHVYKNVTLYLAILAFPVFIGIAITAHLFVPLIFGEKWSDSVIVFQVMSLALIVKLLTANISSTLLYSLNKPDLVFYIDLTANIIYFATLLLFANQGMVVVLILYSLYTIYKAVALQYFTNKELGHGFYTYLSMLNTTVMVSLVMIAGVLGFQNAAKQYFGNLFLFVGSVTVGASLYLLLALLLQKHILINIKNLIIAGSITKMKKVQPSDHA